ncbi:hypothetical protein Tsubulata_027249 [Turnera subulata]|uniref:Peptidase A1 domain-containing protein n=1 Tax=Turnera subulata TaxID=218843 RepID=A0A9Q0F059_9ROSI|nr:hypothetical protein Tsubulata_027249 [Turnera subulata]
MNMVVACLLFGVVSSTEPLAWNNSTGYPVENEKFELFHISQIEHNYNMSLHARLERDEKRIKTLAQVLIGEPNILLVNTTVEQGEMLGTLEYIVRIGVGTPPAYQFLAIDTGSDLPWVQCQPCSKCYYQVNPIYDPKKSSTYEEISCESTKCQLLGKQHSCKDHQCRYNVGYGDGSSSKGVIALENFTFGNAIISNIAFGCGHKNKGHFLNFGGILGLGRGDLSFTGQLRGSTRGIFSYCLVNAGSTTSGWLRMGEEAIPARAAWAPLMYNPRTDPSFYYVGLSGIMVGQMKVPIPDQVFQLSSAGKGGVVIDTGTVISRFPKAAYDVFRDTFIAQTKHLPRAKGISLLDTCYNLTTMPSAVFPNVSLHFTGGPILILTNNNVLIKVEGVDV